MRRIHVYFKNRKLIILLGIVLYPIFLTNAQPIAVPDEIGHHLFQLFINRTDITKSPACLSDEDLAVVLKNVWEPYSQNKLIQSATIRDSTSAQSSLESFDQKAAFTNQWQVKDKWASVLISADKLKLHEKNVEYFGTFFSVMKDQEYDYPMSGMEINVVMSSGKKLYSLNACVQWIFEQWVIVEVTPRICFYERSKYSTEFLYVVPMDNNDKRYEHKDYLYNSSFAIDPLEMDPFILPDFRYFNMHIFQKLIDGEPFPSGDNVLSEDEYIEVNQFNTLKEEANLNDYYIYDLPDAWANLQKELQTISNERKSLRPFRIEVGICNWEQEIRKSKWIKLRTNIAFKWGKEGAGIIFDAIWYKEKWRLSRIQRFTYNSSYL